MRIAIIGAGPVGILLSQLLLNKPDVNVTLFESGSKRSESHLLSREDYIFLSQSGMPSGMHMVGGGSNLWARRISVFPNYEFDNAESEWPISSKEIEAYYSKLFDLIREDSERISEFENSMSEKSGFLPSELEIRKWYSAKDYIFQKLLDECLSSKLFRLKHNSFCSDIRLGEKSVSNNFGLLDVEIIDGEGRIYFEEFDRVVITGGALQSSALLQRATVRKFMLNDKPLGRNLMEHFDGYVGTLKVKGSHPINQLALNSDRSWLDYTHFGVAISTKNSKRELLNTLDFHLEICPRVRLRRFGPESSYNFQSKYLRTLIFSVERIVNRLHFNFFQRYNSLRKIKTYSLWLKSQEYPDHLSTSLNTKTVTKSTGVAKLAYKHKISKKTVDEMKMNLLEFKDIFENNNLGKIRFYSFLFKKRSFYLGANFHPMGNVMFSKYKERSILDENLSVLGVRNLFVASSSVFPSGSYANPTFTALALAWRLSDYLDDSRNKVD
jgi:hypothetical protein